ncbi:MAG: hypothetical protein IIA88_10100, partial [Bacteroidetes bacterium]|nr:hypothetical protein [Bacteroidota bacterium]
MKLKKLLLFGIAIIAITNISRGQASYGTQIGCTYYDLQTNSSVRNGLVRNPDGTMAAVWIQSHSDVHQPTSTDRGIGYNYYDGTQWVYLNTLIGAPCTQGECGLPHGCSSDYIGWPNIIQNDSGEVVIAHFFGAVTGPSITKRPNAGSGPWDATVSISSSDTIFIPLNNPIGGDGLTWPRAVADSNYVHVIYTSPNGVWNGVIAPFVYFRSSDYGTTWDIDGLMLPGIDSAIISGMGADAYALDAR